MGSIAFFGKMPSAADFVRRGVSASKMRPFENWFHEAYTDLRRAGASGLTHRCHLILPDADDANRVLAVVAAPSRDRIGREFPVVVATVVPSQSLPGEMAPLVLAFSRFWNAAFDAVQRHGQGEPDALWETLQGIEPPSSIELSESVTRCHELLSNLGARQMEKECFNDLDDRFYAYHALRLAVQDARDGRVLMCPTAGHPGYRAFWVETIERATERKLPLPIVWLEGAEALGETFVGLGNAPPAMLRYASGHGRQASSLWPLTTESAVARERAKAAFPGEGWDDTEQKLSRLIDVVLGTHA